ncbi:hypothetical protein GGX14DRAFT_568536 [Mycena pura]|uniref:Uncharacterized protein n=1 Tax=Mycena pura TaxID=153505 RepID=A0AAD6Y7S8_9AGAR|nr:hypothetical protein GGX14DRAFT_568536 [Mycena pura]
MPAVVHVTSKSSMLAVVHVTSKSSRMPADSLRLSLRLSPRLYLGQLVPGDDAGHGRTSCGCGGCWERMRRVEAQITARYTVACVAAVVSAHALRRPSPALTPSPTTCPPVLPHAADAATDDAGAPLWRGWRECECTFSAQSPSDDAGAPPWRSWSECAFSVQVFLVCTALVPSPALTREEDGRRRAPLEWQVRGYSHVRCAPVPIPVPILHLFCALMRTQVSLTFSESASMHALAAAQLLTEVHEPAHILGSASVPAASAHTGEHLRISPTGVIDADLSPSSQAKARLRL